LMAGLRYNRVDMNADDVGSSMAMMMAPVAMLADRFNNADRQSTDNNIDWVLRANWMPSERWRYTGAVSRKTRSAGYQEKFLWLPLQATGGLADGRNYVGDLNLNPEVAHELELGFDWDSGRANVAPRVYYRKVDDYIQGTPSDDALVNGVSGMMGNPFVPLQFSNVEATLYGFDMNWGVAMDDHWSLYGLLNYVRGERDDIDDNLYRIAAPNTTLGVNYQTGGWQVALEGVAYARQTKVSDTNGETETAGYGLLNVLGQLQMGEQLQLSLGVKNLLDRDYQNHLGGINRAVNEDIPVGDRLPGWGRNLYASVRWDF
jgi:iron complex outermembrane receptor protein